MALLEGPADTAVALVHTTWMEEEEHCCPPAVGNRTKVVRVLRVNERVPPCPLAFGLNVEELQHSVGGLWWVALSMIGAHKELYFQQDQTMDLSLAVVYSNQYVRGQNSEIQWSCLHSNSIQMGGQRNCQV